MAEDLNQQAFTVKDWLQRIDAKQDQLDDKIDKVAATMDRKADDRDLRALIERTLILEQVNVQRLEIWNKLAARVDKNTDRLEDVESEKADRADISALWKILLSSMGGAALAILAWALTVFGGH